MSITTYSEFEANFLVKNGMPSNDINLNRAPRQLKTEIDELNLNKQVNLVSGTNIKTINGTSVLGSGNIVTTQTTITGNAGTATKLQTARTINGVSFDGSANISVNTNNSEIIKFDSGTTEGTDLYTFNGSSAKTIDIKAGTNITLTKSAGSITISTNDTSVAWSEITSKPTTLSGYGITDSIQSTLVSGTNIKTINGSSILGSGDISIIGGATLTDIETDLKFYPVFSAVSTGVMTQASVSSNKLYFNPSSGTLNATEFNAFSDINLKENIITIDDALNKVLQLRGVNYYNKNDNSKLKMGVIAQEVQKIIPEVINDSGEFLTVNYNSIIGLLIETVKELNNKIEDLQKKI